MRFYTQSDRDKLVMEVLDIYNSQFIDKLDDAVIATLESEGLDQYVVNMVIGLEESDGLIYMQQIASMSDLSLHRIVQIFGKDPLDG